MADETRFAANEPEKRTTRVGICFADYETFWWAADRPDQAVCPACSLEDEDYAANHRFYVAEAVS